MGVSGMGMVVRSVSYLGVDSTTGLRRLHRINREIQEIWYYLTNWAGVHAKSGNAK